MLSTSLKLLSTLNRHPQNIVHPPPPSIIEPVEKKSLKIFDPDNYPLVLGKIEEELEEQLEEYSRKNERKEIIEENRADGHAPIKTALGALMQGLQQSSSKTTSLSDIDVTLFNFHSTIFAERLLNRNVSSVVIVESSHVFSKNAKKFATQHRNVDAYRADISTLMGVGRKKTAKFPKKLLFCGKTTEWSNIKALKLEKEENEEKEEDEKLKNKRKPHFLAVLPTGSAQKTILESMIQHALLHHSNLDPETIFAFGEANLLTFLNCGILSQYMCSKEEKLGFLSHQHRRNSTLFKKLFEMKLLHTREVDGTKEVIPIGYSSKSFHPQLPVPKKMTHEKKLAELNLDIGKQYAVRILPKKRIEIGGKWLGYEEEENEKTIDASSILSFAHFMQIVGKQPNAKKTEIVIRSLWPESCSKIGMNELTEKIGQMPDEELEGIFEEIREELENTMSFQTFVHDLKIKRLIV